jgi:hypothetical protein
MNRGLFDRVRGGEKAKAILRRPGCKAVVIEPRWYHHLGMKAIRAVVVIILSPLIVPILLYVLIFRRGK